MSKQAVVGNLAPFDAGKTTLAEAMLFNAGRIRKRGRVDDGDSHLDTNTIERERGITIFSSQAVLDHGDTHVMLVDAPGHVDFSAEAERTLRALDYAILVVGANDGVQGHTETLWRLLARYDIPTSGQTTNRIPLTSQRAYSSEARRPSGRISQAKRNRRQPPIRARWPDVAAPAGELSCRSRGFRSRP